MIDLAGHAVSRRRLLKLTAASAAALPVANALAACGGDDAAQAGTITYMSGPSNDQDQHLKDALSAAFTKNHKDVKVNSTFFDWDAMDADLTAAYAGDSPPDIAYLVTRAWPQYADAGALADLTERVKSPSFKETFEAIPQEIWAAVTQDGKIWGVPYLGAVFPVYVNETLLRGVGVSDWDSSYEALLEAARAVHTDKVYGFSIGQTLQEEAFHDIGAYIHNSGGSLLTEDGAHADLNHPAVGEALDFLGQLHTEGLVPRPGLYDGEGKAALFRAGRVAIAHGSVTLVAELSDEKPDFEWGVALAPRGPVAQTAYGDFGFLSMAAASEDQDAAWEYMKYLSGPDAVVRYIKDIGRSLQAVRTDVGDALFPEGDSPAKQLQTEFVPRVKAYSTFPKQIEALRGLLSEYELVIRGKKSGADAVASANDRVNQLLG